MPKNKNSQRTRRCRQATVALACSVAALVHSPTLRAATVWTGAGSDSLWSNPANWDDGVPPGEIGTSNSVTAALFQTNIANTWGNSANNPIVLDFNRNLGWIDFGGASGSYFIGSKNGNTLKVTSSGSIRIRNTLTSNLVATINAPISIQGANGTYAFLNESPTGSGSTSGTLVFGGAISGGAAGSTVLTLDGSNANANTVSGTISDGSATTLGVTKSGTGAWTLSGLNTYSGATTISQGTLRVNSSAALGNGSATNTLRLWGGTLEATGAIASPATRSVSLSGASTVNTNAYDVTIAGTTSGAGGFTKTGAGTLSLTGAYDHTGATTLSQGVLAVSSIGSGTNFVFAGGTLRYTGANASWTRGYTINPATTATIDVSERTTNLTLSAASGATTGGLTKTGAGSLTIAATQTYTGNTELRGGTLVLALGGGSNVVSTSSRLQLTGGLLRLSGGGSQTFNNVTVNASSSTRVQVTDAQTLNLGQIAGTGSAQTVNFNLLGGTAVITGRTVGALIDPNWTVQEYSGFGLATVNASNQVVRLSTPLLPASGSSASTHYRIDNNNGTASTPGSYSLTATASQSALSVTVDATQANGQMNLNSGVVFSTDLWNFGSVSSSAWYIIGSSGGAGIRALTSGGTVQFNNWTTTGSRMAVYTPILDFGTSSAMFMGSGTTVLAAANTYKGSTYVNGGILEVTSGGSIAGTVSNSLIVGTAAGSDATLNLTGGTISAGAEMSVELASTAGSIATANVSSGTWNSGAMRIGNGGTATLKITGGSVRTYQGVLGYANGSSGTVNISGGTWTNAPTVGGGAGGGTLIGHNGVGVVNLSGTGTIDSDTFVSLGNGSTGIGTVTMTGGTWTIRSGGLSVGALGTGVFNMSGGVMTTTGNVLVGNSAGTGMVNFTGGTWTTGSSDTVTVGSTGVFNLSGTASISSGTVGIGGIANVSGGTWSINGTNPNFTALNLYNSRVNLTDGGVIAITVNNLYGTGTVNLGFSSGDVGVLNIGAGGVAGTLWASKVTTLVGAGVVNFNHTDEVFFNASISRNVSVTKQGSGTTHLFGANTYSGATTITEGTILVTGSISGSSITVSNAGSTLGGTGSVANVTVSSGASLQGGDGNSDVGALSSGGIVSLLDGSTIKLTLGTGGSHSSLARTGGLWSFDSDQAFTFNFFASAETGFYDNIITGLAGSEAGLASIATWMISNPGFVGAFTYDNAGGVDLTITAIPEPSTAHLLTLATLRFLGSRRWRRQSGATVAC